MQQKEQFGCGNFSVVGAIKGKVGIMGHSRLLCQCYRCARCRPRKLKRVRARISQIASEKKLLRFVTLTLDPKKIPKNTRSDKHLRETWRKMRVLLARRFGSSIHFVAVLEFQKSGVAHLHVLVGVYIPQEWLSSAWESVGGGKIVDIRYVDVHRIAGYLTRYLAGDKVEHTLSLLPLRARIFSCSRSILLWGKKEKSKWWLCKRSLDNLHTQAQGIQNEHWESLEELKPFGLDMLMYFEARPSPEAIHDKDIFDVLRALAEAAKG